MQTLHLFFVLLMLYYGCIMAQINWMSRGGGLIVIEQRVTKNITWLLSHFKCRAAAGFEKCVLQTGLNVSKMDALNFIQYWTCMTV